MTFSVELLEETVLDAELSTAPLRVPEGEYLGLVDDYTIRSVTVTREGKQVDVPVMDVTWMIPDDDLKKKLGREKVTSRQSIWLELDKDGSISTGPGQNWRLGLLLKSLGINPKGFSFPQLRGAGPARVLVIHEKDKNSDEVRDKIVKVVPAE